MKPTGEPLWSLKRADGVTVSCRLLSRGDYGTEAQIFVGGDLLIARLCRSGRDAAIEWATSERAEAERT